MIIRIKEIGRGEIGGIMAINPPLKLLIARIFEGNKLNKRMKVGALLLTDNLFLKLNNRRLHNKLRLSGKAGHHLVQRLVFNEVLQIQRQLELVVARQFWLEEDVKFVH